MNDIEHIEIPNMIIKSTRWKMHHRHDHAQHLDGLKAAAAETLISPDVSLNNCTIRPIYDGVQQALEPYSLCTLTKSGHHIPYVTLMPFLLQCLSTSNQPVWSFQK